MQALEIATYFLTGLANLEILVGYVLAVIAMATDKQLRCKSNIMIAVLLIPQSASVLIYNLHAAESYKPELLRLSDIGCLVVYWGLLTTLMGTMWLLTAIAIHRYLLCVKLYSTIDTTKICTTICSLILFASILVATTIGTVSTWSNFKTLNEDAFSTMTNLTGFVLRSSNFSLGKTNIILPGNDYLKGENESARQNILKTDIEMWDQNACYDRKDVMHLSTAAKQVSNVLAFLLPMILQAYFYFKINQHLKRQREIFASNNQVLIRLHQNSKAVLRTLFVKFICHVVLFLPMILVVRLGLSYEVQLLCSGVSLNGTTGSTVCFLVLHGGYR